MQNTETAQSQADLYTALEELIYSIRHDRWDFDKDKTYLSRLLSLPLSQEQQTFLNDTIFNFLSEGNIFVSIGDHSVPHKKKKAALVCAALKSGLLRIADVTEKDNLITEASFFDATGKSLQNVINYKIGEETAKGFMANYIKRQINQLIDFKNVNTFFDASKINFPPITPEKFTPAFAREAYGFGLAPYICQPELCQNHTDQFMNVIQQLPLHITSYYISCAGHWLLPHMLTREEVNARPTPLKDWTARVTANKNRAPTAGAMAVMGGV